MTKEVKRVLVVGHTNYGITEMFRQRKDKFFVILNDDKDKKPPDLLVFTGGADVNPKFYGEEAIRNGSRFDVKRDAEDLAAFNAYPAADKVGICRGGQFLNIMSGGAMWQNVNNHGRDHLMHNLLHIGEITEQSLMVTSTHHQMMIPGQDGEVIGIATSHNDKKRGIADKYESFIGRVRPKFDTEVVWYPKTKSLCFQPHPEYNTYPEMREYFFKLINYFFE